ncbi:MAG: pyridoxamine 5'-phosphate oxidase family protein [Myxococcota bacterium]
MQLLREGHLDIDAMLRKPLFAHLATYAPEGPRDSPVWFLYEDDAFWIICNRDVDVFPARIAADPRCALGIVDFDPRTGRVHHVGVRGQGSVEPWDLERAKRKLRRYLGDDEGQWDRSVFSLDPAKRLAFVRIAVDTMVARDQSFRASLR